MDSALYLPTHYTMGLYNSNVWGPTVFVCRSLQFSDYRVPEPFRISHELRVLLVFSGYSGPSEYGLLKSCKGKTKAGKFEATAVRGEYSKNGAKVCKGRSSKIDRFFRCQLLSTFNFSHFQSWGCHTSKWRKHPSPTKCEIISYGDIDVFISIKIC